MRDLTELSFVEEVLHERGIALVAFLAPWSVACRELEALLVGLAPELGGRARVYRVDVDREPGLVRLYRVGAFPTVVVFRNGMEIGRLDQVRTAAAWRLAVEVAETAPAGAEVVRGGATG